VNVSSGPSELTIWLRVGESASGSPAHPMVPPSDKALHPPRAAVIAAGHAADGSALLDQAMDRYARGEDASFEDLYRYGAPRVRGFLVRLCGNLALADDVTQETFLRIHLARGNFVANASALPWMLAIARNAFLDHTRRETVRRTAREVAAGRSNELRDVAAPDTRGDEMVMARETLEIVRDALDRLPPLQREAFVLLRFEGLSVNDAAQIVGATESAIKVRAFRAYEALRSALHRDGERSPGRP
jgi:RNA polymerase sigma-70 factor, ECF subfamily